jgi:CRISPR/Cas system-associated endonuclease/helicase Cas3
METWRHGDGDVETWSHRHGKMENLDKWRHGDIGHGDIIPKTEAQAISHNQFSISSWCKRKFVVCPFVDEETNGSFQLANELNEPN